MSDFYPEAFDPANITLQNPDAHDMELTPGNPWAN